MAINEEEKVDAGMDIKRNMERETVDTVAGPSQYKARAGDRHTMK